MGVERHLLLIEDNPDEEALILHALQQFQMSQHAVVARDGIEALQRLALDAHTLPPREAAIPAAIVMDLQLPRVEGFELLRRVRAAEHTNLVPVIILTAAARPEEIREAYRLGANSVVIKPVQLERFVDAVGRIATYWLKINRPSASPSGF